MSRRKAIKNIVKYTLRGGSFYYHTWDLRSIYRDSDRPVSRYWFNGFRLIARAK